MAEIKVYLGAADGVQQTAERLLSMELCSDAEAPCDALSLLFLCEASLFEVHTVRMELDGKTVFSGYCDRQRTQPAADGVQVFLYARSSAALLVDSAAEPMTYRAPTAQMLFHREAAPYGFTAALPALSSEYEYTVERGASRYGAINNFVQTLCRKPVRISPQNELFLPDGSGEILLDSFVVTAEARMVNRGGAVLQIDYKTEGDAGYLHHCKSRLLEKNGIVCSRKADISALPAWQRKSALTDMLYGAAQSYCEAQFAIDGCHCFSLFDRAVYRGARCGSMEGYRLSSFVMTKNAQGEATRLTFRKELDLKEITYVAE